MLTCASSRSVSIDGKKSSSVKMSGRNGFMPHFLNPLTAFCIVAALLYAAVNNLATCHSDTPRPSGNMNTVHITQVF